MRAVWYREPLSISACWIVLALLLAATVAVVAGVKKVTRTHVATVERAAPECSTILIRSERVKTRDERLAEFCAQSLAANLFGRGQEGGCM